MSCILLISPEPWDTHHTVSKHHYAVELARKGHDVFFLGPPRQDAKGLELQQVERGGVSLTHVRSGRIARGLALMPAFLRNFLERRWLERLEERTGRRIDIIWLFENSRFFDMRFAGDRVKIYHQVDLNQNFHPLQASATADLTIAISGPIERRIKPAARRFLRLGHGVPIGSEAPITAAVLDERFAEGSVHAVLTGNLDSVYLDVDLLASLVRKHPNAFFHFVGGYRKDGRFFAALEACANVIWWGRQPAEALPSILRRGSILLVTYLADRHREQLANPHKILEYLASGRPVLASYTEEYAERPDLVSVAADAGEFQEKFTSMICDLKALTDLAASRHRAAFAAEHAYGRQISRIETALDGMLPERNPLRGQTV